MTPPRALVLLALVPAVAFAAGCGSDDEADGPTSTLSAEERGLTPVRDGAIRVATKNYKYTPQLVFAEKGQKIVWRNDIRTKHDVKSLRGADFRSDVLATGDTFEYTPKKAGIIDYECTLHPGMLGTIVVE